MIRGLHDESKELQLRITNYITASEKLYNEIKTNPAAKHSQDERTIAFLLTLKNPTKYTIYKDSFYRRLCNLLGINSRRKNQKLIHYYELVDLFIEHGIRKDAELTDMVKSRLTDDAYHDPEYK